jgi:hypothetical protein
MREKTMIRRHAAKVVLALMAATLLGAAPPPQLVAQWSSPADTGQKVLKILAIGITDDRELRHRFEDNVVTHLRGKDILAVTSYSLVPDLKAPGSREEILQKIEAQKIDSALSFRAVPLEKSDEAAWDAAWMREAEGTGTLRELIQRSLPVKATKSKLYGVEVTLWVTGTPARLWSGRTGAYKLSDLRNGASALIEDVIDTLRYSHRI